jgi:drug/metabolite transporter (DMT)-like permease
MVFKNSAAAFVLFTAVLVLIGGILIGIGLDYIGIIIAILAVASLSAYMLLRPELMRERVPAEKLRRR